MKCCTWSCKSTLRRLIPSAARWKTLAWASRGIPGNQVDYFVDNSFHIYSFIININNTLIYRSVYSYIYSYATVQALCCICNNIFIENNFFIYLLFNRYQELSFAIWNIQCVIIWLQLANFAILTNQFCLKVKCVRGFKMILTISVYSCKSYLDDHSEHCRDIFGMAARQPVMPYRFLIGR